MIILIAGATHTGKTRLAQKLLESLHYPYLSMDHLKMGLIRSNNTDLTPMDDDKLTDYLWPITREIIKTAIENKQNLMIEGCYIPFDWKKDFAESYLRQIRYLCLIMSREYIKSHFDHIRAYASVVEHRMDDSQLCAEALAAENEENLSQCLAHDCRYVLIDEDYTVEPETVIPYLL